MFEVKLRLSVAFRRTHVHTDTISQFLLAARPPLLPQPSHSTKPQKSLAELKRVLSENSFVLEFCVWGGEVAGAQLGLLSMEVFFPLKNSKQTGSRWTHDPALVLHPIFYPPLLSYSWQKEKYILSVLASSDAFLLVSALVALDPIPPLKHINTNFSCERRSCNNKRSVCVCR